MFDDIELIGAAFRELCRFNFMIVHDATTGALEIYYAPTPTMKVMPVAVGDDKNILQTFEKAVEVATLAQGGK